MGPAYARANSPFPQTAGQKTSYSRHRQTQAFGEIAVMRPDSEIFQRPGILTQP
jgi:hypothetical protein